LANETRHREKKISPELKEGAGSSGTGLGVRDTAIKIQKKICSCKGKERASVRGKNCEQRVTSEQVSRHRKGKREREKKRGSLQERKGLEPFGMKRNGGAPEEGHVT